MSGEEVEASSGKREGKKREKEGVTKEEHRRTQRIRILSLPGPTGPSPDIE